MKKPPLIDKEWKVFMAYCAKVGIEHEDGMLEVASVGWISPKSDEEEIQVAQAISAVPEMIDALMYVQEEYYNGETMPFDIAVIEEALKKAGVILDR